MKIAFIGLGNMGGGMAANLVKAGHDVRASTAPPALEARAGRRMQPFSSVREAVQGAEAVVSMLPNGAIVKAVYAGDVLGHALPRRCCWIVHHRRCHRARGGRWPRPGLSHGGCAGFRRHCGGHAGTLTFMVGAGEDFAAAEPILAAMGKAVIHAGGSGAGQAAKICNNMLLGASMVATCETFRLAERLGLDLQTFDIASKASASAGR
jgi:3-hydroxyisobutyrate dehydrogenase